MSALTIGGLTPLTTTDYPEQLAAVVFCQGCPWNCRYCHNGHLIPRRSEQGIPWFEVRQFLERRRGLLDAVVFSGGEPTLQAGLADAMGEARSLGFKIGLHTAGPRPDRLAAVLPLVDWVGMDIKAPFERYDRITQTRGSGERARESAALLLGSGVDCEFRTTVHPALTSPDDLLALAQTLRAMGVSRYTLQEFRSTGCADPELLSLPAGAGWAPALLETIGSGFGDFSLRRAEF